MKTEDLFRDLVTAMLAVNRWPLEKTVLLSDGLRNADLTNPVAVRAMAVDDIAKRLAEAGYRRGAFMEKLLALRISHAAHVLDDDCIQRVTQMEALGNTGGVRELLLTIKGVGPDVVTYFLFLRS